LVGVMFGVGWVFRVGRLVVCVVVVVVIVVVVVTVIVFVIVVVVSLCLPCGWLGS